MFVLAGTGSAAVMVLTVPLLSDLVPRRHMGTAYRCAHRQWLDRGAAGIACGGSLSDLYGPRAIFALMAAMVAVALSLLPLTRSTTVVRARSQHRRACAPVLT